MRTVVVTGSRDLHNPEPVHNALRDQEDYFMDDKLRIVEGGAAGADAVALGYALEHGLDHACYAANWKAYGKEAGPLRNAEMLDVEKPDVVLAFPAINSKGTWDCIYKAVNRQIPVFIYPV